MVDSQLLLTDESRCTVTKGTCEKFGSSSTIPGLSGWFGICRTNVPTGGIYSAGAEVGGGGGETGRVFGSVDCGRGAEGCGLDN